MLDVKFWRDFKRNRQLLNNIVLTLMLWKRPNPTRCIASVSVQQGPSRSPSLADWRSDCSSEGTCIIPREQYVSSLCPQISENWKNWEIFIHNDPILFIPDPNLFVAIDCSKDLFMQEPIFIHTRSKIFIPDPTVFYSYWILFLFLPGLNSLICWWLFQRVQLSSWIDPCLKIICAGSENT